MSHKQKEMPVVDLTSENSEDKEEKKRASRKNRKHADSDDDDDDDYDGRQTDSEDSASSTKSSSSSSSSSVSFSPSVYRRKREKRKSRKSISSRVVDDDDDDDDNDEYSSRSKSTSVDEEDESSKKKQRSLISTQNDDTDDDVFEKEVPSSGVVNVRCEIPILLFTNEKAGAEILEKQIVKSIDDLYLVHPELDLKEIPKSKGGYQLYSLSYYKKGFHSQATMDERKENLGQDFYEKMLKDIESLLEKGKEFNQVPESAMPIPATDSFCVKVGHLNYLFTQKDFEQKKNAITVDDLLNRQYTRVYLPFAYYSPISSKK